MVRSFLRIGVMVVSAAAVPHPGSALSAGGSGTSGWQRVFDARHPAAPPRLVLLGEREGNPPLPSRTAPCLRAGQPVTLHASRPGQARVSLAALALESAGCGQTARVRILVTGAEMVVRAVREQEAQIEGGRGVWK